MCTRDRTGDVGCGISYKKVVSGFCLGLSSIREKKQRLMVSVDSPRSRGAIFFQRTSEEPEKRFTLEHRLRYEEALF